MRGLCYFFLLILTHVSSSTQQVIGHIGHNVTLPCTYDTQTYGVLSFCWGRGELPWFQCSDTILSSEGGAVDQQSSRYQLLGRVEDGDVSLTILNAQWSDAGEYGCRVEIPGWLNDHKVNTHLVLKKAITSTSILTTFTPTTVETGDKRFEGTNEEEFKAFLGAGNIGRLASFFFLTIVIIVVLIFRRGFRPRKTLEHLKTSTAENIYESVPCSA